MDNGCVFMFFLATLILKRRQLQQAQEVSEVAQQNEQEGLIQVLLALVELVTSGQCVVIRCLFPVPICSHAIPFPFPLFNPFPICSGSLAAGGSFVYKTGPAKARSYCFNDSTREICLAWLSSATLSYTFNTCLHGKSHTLSFPGIDTEAEV